MQEPYFEQKDIDEINEIKTKGEIILQNFFNNKNSEKEFLLLTYTLSEKFNTLNISEKYTLTVMDGFWPFAKYLFSKSKNFKVSSIMYNKTFLKHSINIGNGIRKNLDIFSEHFPLDYKKQSIIYSYDLDKIKLIIKNKGFRNIPIKKLIKIKNSSLKEVINICKGSVNNTINKDLYVMECNGNYKIGRSYNTEKRLREIQCSNPYTVKIVKIYKQLGILENILHKKLKEYRLNGEWFNCTYNRIDKEVLKEMVRQG